MDLENITKIEKTKLLLCFNNLYENKDINQFPREIINYINNLKNYSVETITENVGPDRGAEIKKIEIWNTKYEKKCIDFFNEIYLPYITHFVSFEKNCIIIETYIEDKKSFKSHKKLVKLIEKYIKKN